MRLTIFESFSNFANLSVSCVSNCCESASPRQRRARFYGLFPSWCVFITCVVSILDHVLVPSYFLLWNISIVYPVKPVVPGVGRLHSIASLTSVLLYCVVASYLHPRVNTCWAACIQQGAGLAASPPLICTLSSLYPHKWPNPSQTPLSFVLYCTSFQTPCYQHRLKLLSVTSYSCLTTSHHLSCFPYYC